MLKLLQIVAFAAAVFASAPAQAQSIDDAAWLAGRWVGEGFGGQMEESWAPPVGGQMIGHFRYWRDGVPQFYEIMMLDVAEGGLRMRVKHFNPDFTGWEEGDEWVTFEPVAVTEDSLHFNGLEIMRMADDRIVMTIQIRRGEEVVREILHFRRAPL